MIRTGRQIVARWILAALLCALPGIAHAQANAASHATAGNTAAGETSKAQAPEKNTPEKNTPEKDEDETYRHSPMVVKLGGMMGMNPEQSATAFEVTNFLLLAVLVAWVLVKMVPRTLRDRNSAIQKHLVDARTATEEASARLSGVEGRLGKLDAEIAALRTQAEQDSVRDEARVKASIEDEKKKIVVAAEQEIASATMQARKQLQQYAADLAIENAGRKLVVSAETDRLLVQNFAQRLAGDDSKKDQN